MEGDETMKMQTAAVQAEAPMAPAMDGLPVRRMRHAQTPERPSSATSSPYFFSTSGVSTAAPWRDFATVRNELGRCFANMDLIEAALIASSSAAPGG
jgi:hypothetical protein